MPSDAAQPPLGRAPLLRHPVLVTRGNLAVTAALLVLRLLGSPRRPASAERSSLVSQQTCTYGPPALTARRYSRSVTGRRATSPRKVAAIPLVTTRGRRARSATLTEHGATRIPQLLRRLRRRGKCAWGSRGQGDGNRRPVVLCRPWGARSPRPRSPQPPPRLLPASTAFQAGSRCAEVWFCLRMRGSALEQHFQARGDGRAASRGGSGRRSP